MDEEEERSRRLRGVHDRERDDGGRQEQHPRIGLDRPDVRAGDGAGRVRRGRVRPGQDREREELAHLGRRLVILYGSRLHLVSIESKEG